MCPGTTALLEGLYSLGCFLPNHCPAPGCFPAPPVLAQRWEMCDLGCGASLSTLEFTHAQDGKGLSRLVV